MCCRTPLMASPYPQGAAPGPQTSGVRGAEQHSRVGGGDHSPASHMEVTFRSHIWGSHLLGFPPLFIYLFLVMLGLRGCARAFSSCGSRGYPLVAVHGLLTEVVSRVAEHGLSRCSLGAPEHSISSCGARA